MRCHECNGKKFETRPVELATAVGRYTVVDTSLRRPVCVQCGEFTVSADALRKVELRAAVVAYTDAPEVTGGMLRFARKALNMTQAQLANRIGTTHESVSRWEREERQMEQWVPLAVLGLLRAELMPPPKDVELRKSA